MAITYNSYFNKLPKIDYDINNSLVNKRYENVTNIFFRVKYVREVLNNISSYYTLELDEGDTPEVLAEKIYGDAGAGWMIILANEIIDPQFEWPLDYQSFINYIKDKYGSLEIAKTTVQHYEMVIQRAVDNNPPESFEYIIDKRRLTKNDLSIPYNYYEIFKKIGFFREPEVDYSADTIKINTDLEGSQPFADADQIKYRTNESFTVDQPELTADLVLGREGKTYANGSLARSGSYTIPYDLNGVFVTETVSGREISVYEYEEKLNEQKRLIKVIKKEYYEKILGEFDYLTGYSPSFLRVVR